MVALEFLIVQMTGCVAVAVRILLRNTQWFHSLARNSLNAEPLDFTTLEALMHWRISTHGERSQMKPHFLCVCAVSATAFWGQAAGMILMAAKIVNTSV